MKFVTLILIISFGAPFTLQAQECSTLLDDRKIVEEIDEYKYYVHNRRGNPVYEGLISAILNNAHICIIEALLKDHKFIEHIDINANNKLGLSLLSASVHSNNIDIVRLLINTPEININDRDQMIGATALIVASGLGKVGVVKELLKVPDINVNARNKFGISALMSASSEGHLEVVRELLEAPDINVGSKDVLGYTALDTVNEILLNYDRFKLNDNEKLRTLHPKYKQIVELLQATENN